MSWEKRGKVKYYYEARRVDGKVVKTFLGRGPSADLASRFDAESRRRRAAESAALAIERDRTSVAEKETDRLEAAVGLLLDATLLAAGYRRHPHGSWRRPRSWTTR